MGGEGRGEERRAEKKEKKNKIGLEAALEGLSALGKWNYRGNV